MTRVTGISQLPFVWDPPIDYHVEAIAVSWFAWPAGTIGMREQRADGDRRLDSLPSEWRVASGSEGPMATIKHAGREYVVFVYPHCD